MRLLTLSIQAVSSTYKQGFYAGLSNFQVKNSTHYFDLAYLGYNRLVPFKHRIALYCMNPLVSYV